MGKRVLVVYYSRTGTTRKLAGLIAQSLGGDIEELVDTRDWSGFLGYLAAVAAAVRKEAANIKPPGRKAEDYDLVVIGTPVWALSVSCPVRAYLQTVRDRLPSVAFFCTTGGAGIDRTFRHMEDLSGKKPLAVLGLRMKDVLKGDPAARVRAFVEELKARG